MAKEHPQQARNKGGRPSKRSGRKDKTIGFSVSAADYAAIHLKASEVHMSVSAYCYQMVKNGQVVDVYSAVTENDRRGTCRTCQ